MADITMCSGANTEITCPMKDQCYRYTATPNNFWQSTFAGIPLKISPDGVPSCEHFWRDEWQ